MILETDASGDITRRYLRGNDAMIAQYDGTAAQYYLHDAQGSVRLLTDLAGTITDEYTYDAYGTLTATQGTTDNRYLYTGQPFDATKYLLDIGTMFCLCGLKISRSSVFRI